MQWLKNLRGARTNPAERGTPAASTPATEDAAAPDVQPETVAPEADPNFVDVQELIATLGVEELCQTAENYFQRVPSENLLAKPWRTAGEMPPLLARFSHLVQGLDLWPHQIVLDFGAGPGWASRMLTQMGCELILADVSPSALNIARTLYERLPPIGAVPAPTFLLFDGHRLDLPDHSIDRIFCFDAFHHVPNPTEVIREMGRVLAPGGIAGFAEPGPEHSRSVDSQTEMRNYRVVENDIRIEQIWADAQTAGFDDLRLSIFHVPLFDVNLSEFDAFLSGGPPLERYARTVRAGMQGQRLFFLTKNKGQGDSRTAPGGLRCQITVTLDTENIGCDGAASSGAAEVTNTGTSAWRTARLNEPEEPKNVAPGTVRLGVHLMDADGKTIEMDFARASLRRDGVSVLPGETVRVPFTLSPLPEAVAAPGTAYRLAFDLVSEEIRWLADIPGGAPAVVIERQV